MSEVLDTIYKHLREKEVRIAKSRLKRTKIDSILQSISKGCWYYGIKDEVIMKNCEMLLIKLTGKKKIIIPKYHKTDMVFWDEFEKLITAMESQGVEKAVYITTGVFDSTIKEYCSQFSFIKNVQLVDCGKFIRKQLGLLGNASDRISKGKICFMEYMPD